MDNDTWMTLDNETWIATLNNDTLTFSWDNDSDVTNASVSPPQQMLTEDELRLTFAQITYGFYYQYNFPITFVVCLIGLVTNSLNIIVFTRKNMINSVNFFLAALSVADILLICSQLPYTIHHFFGFRSQFDYNWVVFYIFLIFLESYGIMICNWLAVTVGIWRWLAVNWPLRAREWCSMFRAKMILTILVVSGLLVSLPVFPLLCVKGYHLYGKILYTKGFTDFAKIHQGIFLQLFWGGLVLVSFVPCLVLVIINGLLFRTLLTFRSQRRKHFATQSHNEIENHRQMQKNYKTTAMLTVLLVLFVINSLPDSALVLVAFFTSEQQKMDLKNATDILRMFNMVNNAISFFVYYFMGENFRSTFKSIFNVKNLIGQASPGKKFSIVTLSTDIVSGSGGTPRNSTMTGENSPQSRVSLNPKITDV